MPRPAPLLALLLLLLTSCSPSVAIEIPPVASSTPAPAATPLPHAPEIRFALIGDVNNANVWATFDSQGYSYNDYAIRSEYWPRLYHLTVPDGRFEPLAAVAMPSPVQPDNKLFSATVPLRPGLRWTDGSPFTAADVAFTVNTALAFQLGFDWRLYYDPATLDHAEALDDFTVKFVFKRAPDVAHWQYGPLQGPIVQKAFWSSKVSGASELLPPAAALAQIDGLTSRVAQLQSAIATLVASGVHATGDQARELQRQLQNQQGDLDAARNDLASAESGIASDMQAARHALYALDASDEPTLGTWTPAGKVNGLWTNTANPARPFGAPNFDSATYALFPDQSAALVALRNGRIDAILDPLGISLDPSASPAPPLTVSTNVTSSARFLVINPVRPALSDPALRRAIFCAISRPALAQSIGAAPLASFVPAADAVWSNPESAVPCGYGIDPLTGPDDPAAAAAILKAAGYTWTSEPSRNQPGSGLARPGGQPFPPIALLAPSAESDPQSASAAAFVERAARQLGIPLTVQPVAPEQIRFALLNGHDYDLALAGWRLSAYPGYLCDWFGPANPFGYADPRLLADCQSFASTSDLDSARQSLFDAQLALAQDPAFIPLYSIQTYDLTRGLVYPFGRLTNGLSGVYGAPSLALPAPAP